MPSRRKIRIGFIGCGGIAHYHANNMAKIPEAKIVAINDVSPKAIDAFRERFPETKKLPAFDDYRDMLDSVKMDAVEIHTPHTLHFEQAMAAFEKKLHVLCEKPLVCKVEHAEKLIAESQKQERLLMVSYQRHFQSEFRYIKNAIKSGKLGKIQFVSALQCQNWKKATAGAWRQDPALSGGGQLNDSGSHLLDIILWTTGLKVAEVSAFIDNLGTPVDINSALSLKFSNGAQGNISVVGDAPTWWEDITIWGSKGAIFYRNGKIAQQVPTGGKGFEPTDLPTGSSPDANFINTILGKEELESPGTCGLRVIELTEAAWKSAEIGQPVKVK